MSDVPATLLRHDTLRSSKLQIAERILGMEAVALTTNEIDSAMGFRSDEYAGIMGLRKPTEAYGSLRKPTEGLSTQWNRMHIDS
jgi:hypothetical protein